MEVLKKALALIKPDKGIMKKVNKFLKELEDSLKENRLKAVPFVGGSIAKDTYLKNDHDCDLFIKFDTKYKTNELSTHLEKALVPFKATRVHGSRDYFQLVRYGINFEIVPVFNIKNVKEAQNITDASPFHVEWVKKFKKSDDIRLTKAFCKANGVYGAESHIKGFSGHVIDIITIYYGGFIKLLKAALKWDDMQLIDYYNKYKGNITKLNQSKISPLIVIDPVQTERNAAAALSKKKIDMFIAAAKKFLKRPTLSYFIKKQFKIADVEKKYKNKLLVISEVVPFKGKTDVVGAKVMKAFEYISKQVRMHQFKVIEADWHFDEKKSYMWYVFKKDENVDEITMIGPPENQKANVKKFLSKHKNVFVKNKRYYAIEKSKFKTPSKLISVLLKSDYVKEKIKRGKLL